MLLFHANNNNNKTPLASYSTQLIAVDYRIHKTPRVPLLITRCLNIDKGKATAMVLLDLSAAFVTLDHSGIIQLLSDWYGVSGSALDRFRLYLTGRQQRVKVNNHVGEPFQMQYGVPQGSVLGPLLFTLYTAPLSMVINKNHVDHHLYADDTQIWAAMSGTDPGSTLSMLRDCLHDVYGWT